MSYESELEIDVNSLDSEWLQQSRKFMRWSEKADRADSETRRAKEQLEITKAERYISIRQEKEEAKEKVTEAILESLVRLSPEYQQAMQEYIDILEDSKIYSSAVKAFEQRKYALENLVKLKLAGYFSEPKDVRAKDLEKASEEVEQQLSIRKRRKANVKKS